jgi:hypothetical protein
LKTLHAFFQSTLPYHSNVEGNDTLFRNNPDYFTEMDTLTQNILEKINSHLLALKKDKEVNSTFFIQALIEVLNTIVQCFALGDGQATQTVYARSLMIMLRQEGKLSHSMKDFVKAFVRNTKRTAPLVYHAEKKDTEKEKE